MSIKKIVDNLLSSLPPKQLEEQRFTLAEMEELAQRDNFGAILTAAGVPDTPIPEAIPEKWAEGQEFDASKFDDAAYKKYHQDFFKK